MGGLGISVYCWGPRWGLQTQSESEYYLNHFTRIHSPFCLFELLIEVIKGESE